MKGSQLHALTVLWVPLTLLRCPSTPKGEILRNQHSWLCRCSSIRCLRVLWHSMRSKSTHPLLLARRHDSEAGIHKPNPPLLSTGTLLDPVHAPVQQDLPSSCSLRVSPLCCASLSCCSCSVCALPFAACEVLSDYVGGLNFVCYMCPPLISCSSSCFCMPARLSCLTTEKDPVKL